MRIKRECVEERSTTRENERSEALSGNSWSLGGFPIRTSGDISTALDITGVWSMVSSHTVFPLLS